MTLAKVKSKLKEYVNHWKERERQYAYSHDQKMEGYSEGKWRAFQRALMLLSKFKKGGK